MNGDGRMVDLKFGRPLLKRQRAVGANQAVAGRVAGGRRLDFEILSGLQAVVDRRVQFGLQFVL